MTHEADTPTKGQLLSLDRVRPASRSYEPNRRGYFTRLQWRKIGYVIKRNRKGTPDEVCDTRSPIGLQWFWGAGAVRKAHCAVVNGRKYQEW